MSKFDDFLDAVLSGAVDLAHKELADAPTAALADTRAFLAFARNELKGLTTDLAKGDISFDEFEELARDLRTLAKLVALSDLGILKTRLERFRTGLIDLVVSSARTVFLPA